MKPLRLLLLLIFILSCDDDNKLESNITPNTIYAIDNGQIIYQGNPIWLKGVNALNTFGIVDHALLDSWQVTITREFIGNLREQPIAGPPIQATDGVWLHSLERIVQINRMHGRVTILCPFGWVNTDGEQILLTGKNPSEQTFYDEYKMRMREIAELFAGQADVWVEVWNEPYHWNNENGYSHDLWFRDQMDMIGNLRSVEGFDNIILIPGNEQGQSEVSIMARGAQILSEHYNVLFDLHAYEKWLIDSNQAEIENRINKLKMAGFAIFFGEVGVINASGLMPTEPFLEAVSTSKTSTCGWLWNLDSSYQNALLTEGGLPNNNDNNNWGDSYRFFMLD